MLTTREIAALVGVTPHRLCKLAALRGVKPAKTIGRNRMWHKRDADKLRPMPAGRPKKPA